MKLLARCDNECENGGSAAAYSDEHAEATARPVICNTVSISQHGQADGIPPVARGLPSAGSVEEQMVQQLRAFEVQVSGGTPLTTAPILTSTTPPTMTSNTMGKSISFSSENTTEQGGIVNMAASIDTTTAGMFVGNTFFLFARLRIYVFMIFSYPSIIFERSILQSISIKLHNLLCETLYLTF